MQRIHSLLIAGLFFIVFAIANERTFQCGTKVKFEDIVINEKLNEMKSYYKSSFRACRFKKLCIRRRLRKLIWRRRNYTGSSDNANLPDSMALWLPIRKSGEKRSGLLRRKSNTYQVVAMCTKRTSCELLRVTERSRGKKSIETACPEIRSQNIVRPSFSKLFTFKQAPEGAS